MNLDDFIRTYMDVDDHDPRLVLDVDVTSQRQGDDRYLTPWIFVHSDQGTFILNVMPFNDHTCIDVHAFDADGEDARSGVFGMEEGRRYTFGEGEANPPGTSHRWPAAKLVAVLLGEQKENG